MKRARHIVVIGAGHAGCEAAFAAARCGARVSLFSLSLDAIALMPCNPCIGGTAKGHLVREIDALGGEMALAADHAFIQSRMLNTAKGPAVHSLRAQQDKQQYQAYMRRKIENHPAIDLFEGEIADLLAQDGRITAAVCESGRTIACDAVVVTCGTYLNPRCLYGTTITHTGPAGLRGSFRLSSALVRLGFSLMRFKTGTPARVHRRSIDFAQTSPQHGDCSIVPFSFLSDPGTLVREQVPCHLTYTNPRTHEIIRESIHKSAMYSGEISATGTRYCPSIEDKIVRFADKDRHQVFIEPEGACTQQMYIQGLSSALPLDVQQAVYASIPGLAACEIMRAAYAIEYDCIDSTALTPMLEAKHVRGLFFAGQINGSSGYEEAAAQGLVAGAAAAGHPVQINRSEGYVGVLIDDLVTKGTREPYRMMTGRAEYRLHLRQDNADLRLTQKAYDSGLVCRERFCAFAKKADAIAAVLAQVKKRTLAAAHVNPILLGLGAATVEGGIKMPDFFKRAQIGFRHAAEFFDAADGNLPPYVWQAVCEQAFIQIKYEGYIALMHQEIEGFRKNEGRLLPQEIDYSSIRGLRLEAVQKLSQIRPHSLGQAARITGVSPADISVIMVYLKSRGGSW